MFAVEGFYREVIYHWLRSLARESKQKTCGARKVFTWIGYDKVATITRGCLILCKIPIVCNLLNLVNYLISKCGSMDARIWIQNHVKILLFILFLHINLFNSFNSPLIELGKLLKLDLSYHFYFINNVWFNANT